MKDDEGRRDHNVILPGSEPLDMANACGACGGDRAGDLKGLPTAEEALALRHGRWGVER